MCQIRSANDERTMEMTKTLIVPGLDGSPAPHWQHWWAATDPGALMVDLSDPSRPSAFLRQLERCGWQLWEEAGRSTPR
jgi:Serine hydrolase